MKIQKPIIAHSRHFSSISDDSRDSSDPSCLLVKTTMNAKYHGLFPPHASISQEELPLHFARPPKLIGITGTNGKTTTAALIDYALRQSGYSVALLGTRGAFIDGRQIRPKGLTTPTILELYHLLEEARDCDFCVMEVSSHAIAQRRIAGLHFDLKILSNISSDHLDFHQSLEEYIRTKQSFFGNASPSSLHLINADDPNSPRNASFSYGIKEEADFKAEILRTAPSIQAILHHATGQTPFELPMCGEHNLYNALCAIASVSLISPIGLERICESLGGFGGVAGRMEILSSSPLIVVDFAHTDDGMEKILSSFAGEKNAILFGAGGDRDASKRPRMGRVAEKYASKIYLTSDNPRSEDPQAIITQIAQGIQDKGKIRSQNPDRRSSIIQALQELQEDENLFVLGKGDESEQIIKDKKFPFDDREILRSVLESSTKHTKPQCDTTDKGRQ